MYMHKCAERTCWTCAGDTEALGLVAVGLKGDLMLLPTHMGQTSARVTYTYVRLRNHTCSFHWAYYWCGKPG